MIKTLAVFMIFLAWISDDMRMVMAMIFVFLMGVWIEK